MAKEMYERAAEINHKLYAACYNLGLISLIQKDYDMAEKYFNDSMYEDLEAKSYYQLAKVYALKDEKDKAIHFLNRAIELDESLLEKANKEKCFESIRNYITVSVKMEEKNEDSSSQNTELDEKVSVVMMIQGEKARNYLEKTLDLVENMNGVENKLSIEKRVDMLFNKEKKEKKILEEYIAQKKEKDEREKN